MDLHFVRVVVDCLFWEVVPPFVVSLAGDDGVLTVLLQELLLDYSRGKVWFTAWGDQCVASLVELHSSISAGAELHTDCLIEGAWRLRLFERDRYVEVEGPIAS